MFTRPVPEYSVVDGEIYAIDRHNIYHVIREDDAETGVLISIRFEKVG